MAHKTAFGIDFGTTNTRVAYYDGERLRMVRLNPQASQPFQFPTLVCYQDGEAVAFGTEASRQERGLLLPRPIKWLLDQDLSVEIDGGSREPVDIAADFFCHLRKLVEHSVKGEKLTRAALTIPVHYPPKARRQLQEACKRAGIEITAFFFEPIAAIYCNLAANPVSGVTAVFDWGGGSLDIATVQIKDGVALTRRIDGWHRGGTDFDYALCEQAVNDFLRKRSHIPFAAEQILKRMKAGGDLKVRAESAKVQLSGQDQASLTCSPFLSGESLLYKITKDDFEDLIRDDLVSAETRLHRALHETGISPKLLASLFLSGGTCNIPSLKERLAGDFGDRIVSKLELPAHLGHMSDGNNDIGNATAMGAALLAVHGAEPVFASAIGVRLADADSDRFYPIFHAGEALRFAPKAEKFFVSDASSGVARLLVCDQDDPVRQRAGRLLRVIPVPIDPKENWLKATFTLDRHLVLKVEAEGVKARVWPDEPAWTNEPAWIQHLNLGFRLPPHEPENIGTPSSLGARGTEATFQKGGRR